MPCGYAIQPQSRTFASSSSVVSRDNGIPVPLSLFPLFSSSFLTVPLGRSSTDSRTREENQITTGCHRDFSSPLLFLSHFFPSFRTFFLSWWLDLPFTWLYRFFFFFFFVWGGGVFLLFLFFCRTEGIFRGEFKSTDLDGISIPEVDVLKSLWRLGYRDQTADVIDFFRPFMYFREYEEGFEKRGKFSM